MVHVGPIVDEAFGQIRRDEHTERIRSQMKLSINAGPLCRLRFGPYLRRASTRNRSGEVVGGAILIWAEEEELDSDSLLPCISVEHLDAMNQFPVRIPT